MTARLLVRHPPQGPSQGPTLMEGDQGQKYRNTPWVKSIYPVGKINSPVSKINSPVGHMNLPVGVINLPVGEINLSVGEINLPVGKINLPVGEINLPTGQINLFKPIRITVTYIGLMFLFWCRAIFRAVDVRLWTLYLVFIPEYSLSYKLTF